LGRVALELEKKLKPGKTGFWALLPLREIRKQGYENAESFASDLSRKYPLQLTEVGGGEQRIESGLIFTNDPARAQEVLTVLAVLPAADLAELSKFWTDLPGV